MPPLPEEFGEMMDWTKYCPGLEMPQRVAKPHAVNTIIVEDAVQEQPTIS